MSITIGEFSKDLDRAIDVHSVAFDNLASRGVTMPLLKFDIYLLRSHWFCRLHCPLLLLTTRSNKIEISLSNDTVIRSSTLCGPSENRMLAREFYMIDPLLMPV